MRPTSRQFLRTLGYHHQREQDNAAYELFLGGVIPSPATGPPDVTQDW